MKSLCIFCGSTSGTNGDYSHATQEISQLLAQKGITLVYGGGSFGLMGIAADGALKHNGKVVGVIPQLLVEKEAAKRNISELHIVDSMQERKQKMMDLSDGFLILPGGVGTLDELFEVMAFINLGVHKKPCGLLNINGFYDSLIRFVDHATQEGFIRPITRNYLVDDSNPKILLDKMEKLNGK
jgi:uncharacterized protein (TIGR00730 family)